MLPCLVESTLHFPYTSNRSVGAAKSISISISMLSQQQQQQQQKAALPTEIVPLIALNMRQVAASFRPRALPALLLLLLWFGVTRQPSVSQSLTVSLSLSFYLSIRARFCLSAAASSGAQWAKDFIIRLHLSHWLCNLARLLFSCCCSCCCFSLSARCRPLSLTLFCLVRPSGCTPQCRKSFTEPI